MNSLYEMKNSFRWDISTTNHEVKARNRYYPENNLPYFDKVNREKCLRINRWAIGIISTVEEFSLNSSNTLTVISGPRSNWESLHNRISEKFDKTRVFFDDEERVCEIKDVKFNDLKCFFEILDKNEKSVANIDLGTEIAFTEFGKPSFSIRLENIGYDESKIPEHFIDHIVTMELMEDPVIAEIDKPIDHKDFDREKSLFKGDNIYDRKTFELLKGKCPITNQPLRKKPIPCDWFRFEILEFVRQAEAEFEKNNQ